MNESIKFKNDSAVGSYSENDTGVMVAICRDYTDQVVAIVRLTSKAYVLAPLGDVEYNGE